MTLIPLRESPALKAALIFGTGILLGKAGNPDPIVAIGLAGSLLIFLGMCVRKYGDESCITVAGSCALILTLGTVNGTWPDRTDTSRLFPEGPALVVGEIVEPPSMMHGRIRFLLQALQVKTDSGVTACRTHIQVTVQWKDSPAPCPQFGMVIALRGTISRPGNERNPGEFNQRKFYETKGIHRLMFVRNASDVRILRGEKGASVLSTVVLPVRRYALQCINELVGDQEGEFLKGVMLGEKGGLARDIRNAFTSAGVAHILAVSGGNVAVVATFCSILLEMLRFPLRGRIIGAGAGVLFYMLLVGDQAPVMRATIMALVMLAGRLLQEKSNPFNSLGVAALVVMAGDGRQLFDIGFQLSFAAVLSIIALYPRINSILVSRCRTSPVARALLAPLQICAVSLVATLGTLPLTAAYFGQVSLVGLLANVVVVPASGLALILGFIMIPLSLAGSFAGEAFGALNKLLLKLTLDVTMFSGTLPFAAFEGLSFGPEETMLFYLGVLLLFTPGDWPTFRFLLLTFLVAGVVLIFRPTPETGHGATLRATFLDVGQGDAAIVELPGGETLLIDAGPRSPAFDTGEMVIIPFLKRSGISRIDLLVVTHPHNDHLGGVPGVLREIEVAEVLDCGDSAASSIYREYRKRLEEEACPYHAVTNGLVVDKFAGIRVYAFRVPATTDRDGSRIPAENVNNASVIVKIVYGAVAILFMGDAETEAECVVVPAYGDFLRSSLLKAGHHGSRTSTSDDLLAAVRPQHAVLSVGEFNTFGHPSPSVLHRLHESGVKIHRTDIDGAVIFETDGRQLWKVLWRNR
jgi:competence protein ComEC